MKYKIIGYVLIFLSCALCGYSLSKFYKNKLSCSAAYINMLSSILEKIDMLHLPLNKIYETISVYELERIGYISALRADGIKTSYEKFENKFLFDVEHLDFCEKLGTLPLSDTVKLCNYEITRLSKLLDSQRTEYEKKIKLYPALSLLVGLAVIILII